MVHIALLHYKNIQELTLYLESLYMVFLSLSKKTTEKDQTVKTFANYRIYLNSVNVPFEVIHVSIKYILMNLRDKPLPEFKLTIIQSMINEIESKPLASGMCFYKIAGTMAYRRGLKRNIILDKDALALKDNSYFFEYKDMLVRAWIAGYDQESKNSVN